MGRHACSSCRRDVGIEPPHSYCNTVLQWFAVCTLLDHYYLFFFFFGFFSFFFFFFFFFL